MKLNAIIFIFLFEAVSFCTFAQKRSLLLINSEKGDTVTFAIGTKLRVSTTSSRRQIKGRLNEITGNSLLIGSTTVAPDSIKYIRKKTPAEIVVIKVIGGAAALFGGMATAFVAVFSIPSSSEYPHDEARYDRDMQDYHKNIALGAGVTAAGIATLFIHTPSYKASKGWHAYIHSQDTIKTDSIKKDTIKIEVKEKPIGYPYNRNIASNTISVLSSGELPLALLYDHLWSINKYINISGSVGIGQSFDFVIPFSLGCVIGKTQHRLEIGQMSWISFDRSNPSLLGVMAYRFQSYQGQIFLRGGIQILELSEHSGYHRIQLFGGVGIGF